MKKLLLSLVLLAFAISTTFAQGNYRDIVHLKNGSIIKGVIIEQVPGKQIKIETTDGSVFVYQMNEIEKMAKDQIGRSDRNTGNKNLNISSLTSKGRMFISGSTKFSYSSMTSEWDYGYDSNETDINQFNFKPSIGWFIADGLALSINLEYESSKADYEDYESKESTFMVGPGITYFFGTSNIKPFIQGEYMFGNTKEEEEDSYSSYDSTTKLNGWGLGAGVAFFLNQHISLDLGLGYANISGEDDEPDSDAEMTLKGTTFNGGVSVYF